MAHESTDAEQAGLGRDGLAQSFQDPAIELGLSQCTGRPAVRTGRLGNR